MTIRWYRVRPGTLGLQRGELGYPLATYRRLMGFRQASGYWDAVKQPPSR